ncbi:MAG TPA: peptidoglycan DD-metalloendopeptidase family protein [Vicinamibacterales bacterium]
MGLLCIGGFSVVVLAQTADRARTEALASRAAERMKALQREADQLAAQERTLLGDLRKLEIDRQIKSEEYQQADTQLKRVQAEVASAATRITELERQDIAERPDLRARVVEIYKLGQARYLRMLLATADLRRLGEASRAVATLAKLDRERVLSHQRTLDTLKETRTSLEARRTKLESVRTAASRAQDAAQRAAVARNDLIRDIDRRRDLNAQLSGELQAAQQKLQVALREVAAGASGAAAAPGDSVTLPIKAFRGDLDWPAAGAVRRRFSGRTAASGSPTSNGIEIAVEEGGQAQAVHEGVVAFADAFAGFGNLVIVDHGSQTFSLYGNLLDMAVAKGARVERGQRIGSVGATPAGPAGLYFELRIDGQAVDPLQWLKKR